jgi:4'-phosphopantetheinyl transferase EntD
VSTVRRSFVIDEILPGQVLAVEADEDLLDTYLYPAEEAAIRNAGDKRRREYATGRACAHTALARLGVPQQPILAGAHGEPCWPTGVVGSITHCEGYRACAVAYATEIVAIGIDAEPHEGLNEAVLGDIACAEELALLDELMRSEPATCWDRLLFSAKEAAYKAWFPLARRWLDFTDVAVTFDVSQRAFYARLRVRRPLADEPDVRVFRGRWLVRDGLVLTAVALPPSEMTRGSEEGVSREELAGDLVQPRDDPFDGNVPTTKLMSGPTAASIATDEHAR